jgi:5-methylcytosine-specific restriction protein A
MSEKRDKRRLKNVFAILRELLHEADENDLIHWQKSFPIERTYKTDGWMIKLGSLGSLGRKLPTLELWIDHFPSTGKRCFWFGFYSKNKRAIDSLIKAAPSRLVPKRVLTNDNFTIAGGNFHLRKKLEQSEFCQPIHEVYYKKYSHFGMFDSTDSTSQSAARAVAQRAATFFVNVLRDTAPTVRNAALEKELERELLDNYTRAGREMGYWGRYFLRELCKKGGLVTAKRMLKSANNNITPAGLQTLIDAGRTDLSVEATVQKQKYRPLFTPAELAEARRRLGNMPAYVRRKKVLPEHNFPDELSSSMEFIEGARRRVTVNAYERKPAARRACIAKYGRRCAACDISFEERYGPIGKSFIHVHHKKPLAARRGKYKLNPTKDLIPVCPNCHAMLHTQNPPLGIDELKNILGQRKRKRKGGSV